MIVTERLKIMIRPYAGLDVDKWISVTQPIKGPDIPDCVKVYNAKPLFGATSLSYLKWVGRPRRSLEAVTVQPGPAEDPTSRESKDAPPVSATRIDPRALLYFEPEFQRILTVDGVKLARHALRMPELVGAGDHTASIGDYNVARPINDLPPPNGDRHCDSALVALWALRAFKGRNSTITRIASKENEPIDDEDPRTYYDLWLPIGHVAFGDFRQREHYARYDDFIPDMGDEDPDNCRVTFAMNTWETPADFNLEQREKHNLILGYRDDKLDSDVLEYWDSLTLLDACRHIIESKKPEESLEYNLKMATSILRVIRDIPELRSLRKDIEYIAEYSAAGLRDENPTTPR